MNVIMRELELAGEERSYIGSALGARGNDCHARAKGVDRGARCMPLAPLTRTVCARRACEQSRFRGALVARSALITRHRRHVTMGAYTFNSQHLYAFGLK